MEAWDSDTISIGFEGVCRQFLVSVRVTGPAADPSSHEVGWLYAGIGTHKDTLAVAVDLPQCCSNIVNGVDLPSLIEELGDDARQAGDS